MGGDFRDKAGGLICVGHLSPTCDDRLRRLLDLGVSGVLLYGAAYRHPEEVARLTHSIKMRAGRPVFIAVDHEAAAYHDEAWGFSRMPEATALGAAGDQELARHVGQVLGRELWAVGVDMTLGPVLDVATNPDNPVLKDRALDSDPDMVALLGAALIAGQQSEGVAACAKHFPGHGDTLVDSKRSLPSLPHGVDRLEAVELRPFQAAIEERCAGMMVGHLSFAALDPEHPASLSRPIVYGLLRQKLGYRGFVMIDDIDMGALTHRFSRAEVATYGIMSGADCFLCACLPESASELIDAIDAGVQSGAILPERIEAARRRTNSLLHRYSHDPGVAPDLSAVGRHPSVDLDPSTPYLLDLIPKIS